MSSDDDKVGYKKPPKHTRFQKGHSGNKGRRRRRPADTLFEALKDALAPPVTVNKDGVRKTMSSIQMVVEMTMMKAARGDAQERRDLLSLIRLYPVLMNEKPTPKSEDYKDAMSYYFAVINMDKL